MGKLTKIRLANQNRGFTLVEMLVAVFIFGIAITTAASLFINVLKVQRKVTLLLQAQQNARYAMETIIREARMSQGSNIEPALNVEGGGTILTLTTGNNQKIFRRVHRVGYDAIEMTKIEGGVIKSSADLTSDEVDVTNLLFTNFDCDYNPAIEFPPRQQSVTITMEVESIKGAGIKPEDRAQIGLQTTVSSRDYRYNE